MRSKLYAVSIWAVREDTTGQDFGVVSCETVYKDFGALEAQSDEQAKEKAIEVAKEKFPQSDGYTDHRCVIFELTGGWFFPPQRPSGVSYEV